MMMMTTMMTMKRMTVKKVSYIVVYFFSVLYSHLGDLSMFSFCTEKRDKI